MKTKKYTKEEAQQIKDAIESLALVQQVAGCQYTSAKNSGNH